MTVACFVVGSLVSSLLEAPHELPPTVPEQ
jgi:hypothetical protein